MSTAITAGTIFASSWGYEQTNVTFYGVVKATAKTVTVRRLRAERIGHSCVPSAEMIGDSISRKVSHNGNVPVIRIDSCEFAEVWSGRPETSTSNY